MSLSVIYCILFLESLKLHVVSHFLGPCIWNRVTQCWHITSQVFTYSSCMGPQFSLMPDKGLPGNDHRLVKVVIYWIIVTKSNCIQIFFNSSKDDHWSHLILTLLTCKRCYKSRQFSRRHCKNILQSTSSRFVASSGLRVTHFDQSFFVSEIQKVFA